MQVSFSILVPTRDRSETLFWTISSIVLCNYENIEIIVSDNFSSDNTQEVVSSFKDKRIKYFRTNERLSMSSNFEFALSKAMNDYVISIGDDDAVLPSTFSYLNELITNTNVDAIACSNVSYNWDSFPDELSRNRLSWSFKRGFEIRNTKEWLEDFFTFRPGYTHDLPCLYCGVVSRRIIEQIKGEGLFFRSVTPDAYSSFAISHFVDKYIYSFTPFVIHGASGKSNGASGFLGKDYSEAKKFVVENSIPVNNGITICPSFRVHAMEAYLQFRDNYPLLTKGNKIDWKQFLCAVKCEIKDHNANEISRAVEHMAQFYSIPLSDIKPVIHSDRKKNINYFFSKIFNLRRKYFIKDAKSFGVYNVRDAALLLNFLITNERVKVSNSLDMVFNKFKK